MGARSAVAEKSARTKAGSRSGVTIPKQTRVVHGQEVIEERPVYSPLPVKPGQQPVIFRGMKILVLADKSEVFACADCEDAIGDRGEIRKHRAQAHGARMGGNPRKETAAPLVDLSISLGELLELAGEVARYAELFELQEIQLKELRVRAEDSERRYRQIKIHLERAGFVVREDN